MIISGLVKFSPGFTNPEFLIYTGSKIARQARLVFQKLKFWESLTGLFLGNAD
jgi:hypothetical protein